ncbi:MAG: SEFIR domain-containing protein [Chloroflexota bacterium]
MTAPTVFISYSQDSNEHNARVLELANRLRAHGIDAAHNQCKASFP